MRLGRRGQASKRRSRGLEADGRRRYPGSSRRASASEPDELAFHGASLSASRVGKRAQFSMARARRDPPYPAACGVLETAPNFRRKGKPRFRGAWQWDGRIQCRPPAGNGRQPRARRGTMEPSTAASTGIDARGDRIRRLSARGRRSAKPVFRAVQRRSARLRAEIGRIGFGTGRIDMALRRRWWKICLKTRFGTGRIDMALRPEFRKARRTNCFRTSRNDMALRLSERIAFTDCGSRADPSGMPLRRIGQCSDAPRS